MQLSRYLFYTFLLSATTSLARPGDSPNDDSDDDLPSCAAACSNAMSSSAIAQGSNSNNFLEGSCTNSGILSAFKDCVNNSNCSGDDQDGADDWIHSTCKVVARTASATQTTSPASTTSNTASTTSSGSTITSSATSTSSMTTTASTTSAMATATPTPDAGLSTGAKAGIGIGVALGVLLLAAIIGAYCVRRMRKSRRESQTLWPNNVNSWERVRDSVGAGGGAGGLGGLGPAAAMAERGSHFNPHDSYNNGWAPLPAQPELSNAAERHELHGQDFAPWNELATGVGAAGGAPRGTPGAGGLPGSLAIAGGAGVAGAGAAAANNGYRYVSELDSTSITPAALARKPVNPMRFSQSAVSSGTNSAVGGTNDSRESQSELLSPDGTATGSSSDRRISSVSAMSADDNEAVSAASNVPLPNSPVPNSPVSPSSPTHRQ